MINYLYEKSVKEIAVHEKRKSKGDMCNFNGDMGKGYTQDNSSYNLIYSEEYLIL